MPATPAREGAGRYRVAHRGRASSPGSRPCARHRLVYLHHFARPPPAYHPCARDRRAARLLLLPPHLVSLDTSKDTPFHETPHHAGRRLRGRRSRLRAGRGLRQRQGHHARGLDEFVKLLVTQGATDSPQLREQVKQEMINRQIFVQAAEEAEYGQAGLRTDRDRAGPPGAILVARPMTDHLWPSTPVTDAQVQAEYDEVQGRIGQARVQGAHILVKDEKTANDLLAQIKADKTKFDDLARRTHRNPGSAEKATWAGRHPPPALRAPLRRGRVAAEEG